MDLPIGMRITYNVKYRHAIRLNSGDKFLTYLTKLVVKAKASICSTIKKNLVLYCLKSLAPVAAVII